LYFLFPKTKSKGFIRSMSVGECNYSAKAVLLFA
jgi:hypothetical protein